MSLINGIELVSDTRTFFLSRYFLPFDFKRLVKLQSLPVFPPSFCWHEISRSLRKNSIHVFSTFSCSNNFFWYQIFFYFHKPRHFPPLNFVAVFEIEISWNLLIQHVLISRRFSDENSFLPIYEFFFWLNRLHIWFQYPILSSSDVDILKADFRIFEWGSTTAVKWQSWFYSIFSSLSVVRVIEKWDEKSEKKVLTKDQ